MKENSRLIYSGPLRARSRSLSRVSAPDLDNDAVTLERERARLESALRQSVAPEITIVDVKAGDENDNCSDLFVLCEAALPHQKAVEGWLQRENSTDQFTLCRTEHMMPPKRGASGRPVISALAIRRVALRRPSRFFWLLLPLKTVLLAAALYALYLLYLLVFNRE